MKEEISMSNLYMNKPIFMELRLQIFLCVVLHLRQRRWKVSTLSQDINLRSEGRSRI